MTTFQAIVSGLIHGLTEFLPVSSGAHRQLIPFILSWNPPEGFMLGGFSFGVLLSLIVYFRHDWASMISSLLAVIIFRKKPMTLDERLPLFVLVATLPLIIVWYYLHTTIEEWHPSPLILAGLLCLFGIPLWFTDYFSRHNKRTSDWNLVDACVVGVTQCLLLIPGCGLQVGTLCGAFIRNYHREAAMKFALFTAVPVLFGSTLLHLKGIDFHASAPSSDLSWLSFTMGSLLAFLSGLLAIGMIMKSVQQKGFSSFFFYRLILGGSVLGLILSGIRAIN